MWETIKNDPILRTVTIIILGVLGFRFAFDIMFGPRSTGGGMYEGEGMMYASSGYSLGDTLSYIFIISFKLLLIAAVIAALIAIFKFSGKHLWQGGEGKMLDSIKKDPILKMVTIIILSIITLGLIISLFKGSGVNYTYASPVAVYGTGNTVTGILVFLLKFLLLISILGFVFGVVMYLKQNYSKEILNNLSFIKNERSKSLVCVNCNSSIPEDYNFCPECGANLKQTCIECGVVLKPEWSCCPNCGNDIKGADSANDKQVNNESNNNQV